MSLFSPEISNFDKIFDEATILAKIGKKSEAISLLNRAIEMKDSRGEAFLVLGKLHDDLNQKKKQLIYKKGIKFSSKFCRQLF